MTSHKALLRLRATSLSMALSGALVLTGFGLSAQAMESSPENPTLLVQAETEIEASRRNRMNIRYAKKHDNYQEQEHSERVQEQDPRGAGPEAPQEVRSFVEFMDRQAHQLAAEGLERLMHATASLAREPDQQLQQQQQRLQQQVQQFREAEDPQQQSQMAQQVFAQAAQMLSSVQQRHYPQLREQVQRVEQSAQQIQPEQRLGEQGERIHQFFTASSQALQQMAATEPEAPRAAIDQDEERIGGGPDDHREHDEDRKDYDAHEMDEEDPLGGGPDEEREHREDYDEQEMDEEVPLGGGPMMSQEAQAFSRFVQEEQQRGLAEQPERYTYEGLRHMHRALGSLIPAGESQLQEQHRALSQRVEQLEGQREEAHHGQLVREAFVDSAQLLTAIQQRQYPQLGEQARQVQSSAAALRPQESIEAQRETIQQFFQQASSAVQQMDRHRQEHQQQPGTGGVPEQ